MYRPNADYKHRSYSTERSSMDVFLICVKVYAIVAILYSITVWLSLRPQFRFKRIEVSGVHAVDSIGLKSIIEQPLNEKYLWSWGKNNRVLYPGSLIKKNILAFDKRISSASVTLSGGTISVKIDELAPEFRFCTNENSQTSSATSSASTSAALPVDEATPSVLQIPSSSSTTSSTTVAAENSLLKQHLMDLPVPEVVDLGTHDCFWVDKSGYVFAKAPAYSGSPMLTISENGSSGEDKMVTVGTSLNDSSRLTHVEQLVSLLGENNFRVRRITLMQGDDAIFDVGYRWNLAVNIKTEPSESLEHFLLALTELKQVALGEQSQLKIIDVRFGNKVFYQ